uniref:PfkB domain-containing protein n=1 Tax=Panagrellus redivivus TaxID=6233 RepID=A0A7E4V0C1_PANRE
MGAIEGQKTALVEKGNILLVGLCCIDEVNIVKKYPNEDSETRIFEKYLTLGGNVANSAVVARQLTSQVQVCASLPIANPQLTALLDAAKIDTTLSIPRTDPKTEVPVSTCILNETAGSRTVFHYRGNLPEIEADEFVRRVVKDEVLSKVGWIHFEGRNFDHLETMMQKVREWRHGNSRQEPVISVEFEKIRDFNYFERLTQHADVIFMSKDFAKNKGWGDAGAAIEALKKEHAKAASSDASNLKVICPWGEQGVYGQANGDIIHVPAEKVNVVDSLGAGDCFIGACIWALWNGYEFPKALEIANHVAATKCAQRGLQNLNLKGIKI